VTTRNLDFALRIRADLADASKAVDDLEKSLSDGAAAAKAEGQALDAAAAASDRKAAKTKKAATATKEAAQAADAAATAGNKEASAADKNALATERETKARERNARARKQQNQEAAKNPGTSGANGISDAQYKQAMRQLPMQMTDIVSGLATGQSPFMVLMQQGGQLKDSFGGVSNAATAVLGAINPMLVGIAAGAGAFYAIGKAAYDGAQEIKAIENALTLVGGVAGVTADDVASMADELDRMDGVTRGSAVEALTTVASTGQFTGEQLKLVAAAAEQWEQATGQAIDETVSQFLKIKGDPVNAIQELNRQYHFLTEAQLDNIRTLQEQGRQQDAAAQGYSLFAGMIAERSPKMVENIGTIEKAARSLKQVLAETWDGLKALGREDSLDQQIGALQRSITMQRDLMRADGEYKKGLEQVAADEQKLLALRQKQAAQRMTIVDGSQPVDDDKERAKLKWDQLRVSNLSKAAKLEEEIKKIKETGLAAGKSEAQIAEQIAQARARYLESLPKTPQGPKSEAQKDNEAALRELENLQKMAALQDSLADGRTKATEAARIEFEVTQGAYKLADSAVKQQLRDQATLADAANERADADRKMIAVREQILGLQGGGEDASLAKARRELELFKAELEKLGKTDDAAVVSKLLGLRQSQTDLKNLKQTYDQVMGEISIEIQRIQVEQQAGFITEADAQQRIVDLYRSKLGVLRDLVPQMREAALALGGDAGKAALANVEAIEVRLREMETTTNAIQQAFGTTFQQSLNSTLDGLIQGTITLDKAVQSFLVTLVKGWAEWSAQDLSQKAGNWAKSKFGDFLGGGDTKGDSDTGAAAIATAGTTAAQAIVTAGNTVAGAIAGASTGGAAAGSSWGAFAPQPGWQGGSGESLATDAAAMQGAGDSVNAGAAAIGQSAVQLASAAGGLSPGASAIIQAALQLWQAAQAMLVANVAGSTTGYASGGWTGPGGMYDVAGVVHRDEVVIRKKITRQPAMLPFLLDVNARGWAAVDDWRGYANGGLVGGSTPIYDSPAPRYGAGGMPKGGGSSSLNQRLRLVVVDDPNRIPAALKSEVGEESFLFHAGRNTETLKQLLGIS